VAIIAAEADALMIWVLKTHHLIKRAASDGDATGGSGLGSGHAGPE
jgi:hypothetical protein